MQLKDLRFEPDDLTRGLDLYCVGGAVRDCLLELPIKDKDWVVVGSTPEDMFSRGFKPVGADFPVFIHPNTGEEYALARTERKTSKGYHGFDFFTGDVTLTEDLKRRDFTINAMAVDPRGLVYDPYGGLTDIRDRTFRHISESFSEDPVRILRLGRFLSRFPDFSVHFDTLELCRAMVKDGEVDSLVSERVWKELSRSLVEKAPSRFFTLLHEVGAFEKLFPNMRLVQKGDELDIGARLGFDLIHQYLVFSSYFNDFQSQNFAVPREFREYANTLPKIIEKLRYFKIDAVSILNIITASDGIRKPEKLLVILEVAHHLNKYSYYDYPRVAFLEHWNELAEQVKKIDLGDLSGLSPIEIKSKAESIRIEIIKDYIDGQKP